MASAALGDLTHHELDRIAWKFLGSKFTSRDYAQWTIDRRLDGYLLHHGLINVMNDGTVYDALLESVMANIGPARRRASLRSNTLKESLCPGETGEGASQKLITPTEAPASAAHRCPATRAAVKSRLP
jgi:hypothetical protein